MSTENNLGAMLVNLQKMRAGIDSAIAGLTVAIAASGAMVPNVESADSSSFTPQANHQPMELPRGAFLGKSLPAAIKLYLSAVMKKQSIREIATALRDGGVESTSDNFEGVITGCLNRMKVSGEILRFEDGWALAEFYPERLRVSLRSAQDVGVKRPTAKKSAKKKTLKKAAKTPKTDKEETGESLDERFESFWHSRQGEWITFKDVMEGIPDISRQAAASTLGRFAKARGWEKSEDGKYHVGSKNVQEMPKAV
jgi:hypothetical protein